MRTHAHTMNSPSNSSYFTRAQNGHTISFSVCNQCAHALHSRQSRPLESLIGWAGSRFVPTNNCRRFECAHCCAWNASWARQQWPDYDWLRRAAHIDDCGGHARLDNVQRRPAKIDQLLNQSSGLVTVIAIVVLPPPSPRHLCSGKPFNHQKANWISRKRSRKQPKEIVANSWLL